MLSIKGRSGRYWVFDNVKGKPVDGPFTEINEVLEARDDLEVRAMYKDLRGEACDVITIGGTRIA